MIRRSWLLFWRQFSLALKDVRKNLVMIILFWVQVVIIVVFSGLLVSMTWSEMGYKAWMEKLSGQNLYYFQNIGEVSYNAGTHRNLAEILSQTDYVMCSMITVSKGEDYYPAILIIGDSEFVLSDVNQSENDSGVTVLLGSGVENLADEPTGALDSRNSEEVFKILRGLTDENRSVIMATHNEEMARGCDRILLMKDGEIKED